MAVPLSPTTPLASTRPLPRADRFVHTLTRRWLFLLGLLLGLYAGLPWLAPVFMQAGWGGGDRRARFPLSGVGRVIYAIYSTQCHQLPQRSYFLFGPKAMVSLTEVQAAWQDTENPFVLRQFVGNAAMGWKVAWSDRMVSLYTSVFFGAVLYSPVRKRWKPLPLWLFAISLLPLLVDGGSHFISDLAGIGSGFRDSNAWLVALTGNSLPAAFYAGDALGSFNWLMRLLTGMSAGLAMAWFALPYIDAWADEARRDLERGWARAGLNP